MKLNIQLFGGRGAGSSTNGGTREKLSMQIAREIYGKQISDNVARRYGKEQLVAPDGAVLSDYQEWEINRNNGEITELGLKNRLTYLQKGYDASQKEGEKLTREYNLYKQAIEKPDSISPMVENSTNWSALEKKYGKIYRANKKGK